MAYSFSYNDNDMASGPYGITVTRMPDTWLPRPRVDIQEPVRGDITIQSTSYHAREFSVPCVVSSTGKRTLQSRWDSIAAELDPNKGPKKLQFDHIPGRYWLAVLRQDVYAEFMGPFGREFELRFISKQHAYSTTERSQVNTSVTSSMSFPDNSASVTDATNADPIVVTASGHGLSTGDWAKGANIGGNTAANMTGPVTNLSSSTFSFDNSEGSGAYTSGGSFVQVVGGTAPVDPAWYIRNETGGTITTFTLTNSTRSESLVWNGSLGGNRWVKVDVPNRKIYTTTGVGTDPTALSFDTDATSGFQSGRFPRLTNGVVNTMTLSGVSSGRLQAIYRERYL